MMTFSKDRALLFHLFHSLPALPTLPTGVLLPIPVHEQMRELKNELCALLRRIGGIRYVLL
jgi:hypothetical protein